MRFWLQANKVNCKTLATFPVTSSVFKVHACEGIWNPFSQILHAIFIICLFFKPSILYIVQNFDSFSSEDGLHIKKIIKLPILKTYGEYSAVSMTTVAFSYHHFTLIHHHFCFLCIVTFVLKYQNKLQQMQKIRYFTEHKVDVKY